MLVFLVFLSRFCLSTCDDEVWITGGGSSAPSPMVKQWGLAYSILKPSIVVDFSPASGPVGFSSLTSPCRKDYQIDFVSSDLNYLLPSNGQNPYPYSDDIHVVPFFAGAIVLAYNLGGTPKADDPQLFLTREVILMIYSRVITTWDHPNITSINSGLNLPKNQSIILVLQDGASGATAAMLTMLTNTDQGNKTGFEATVDWDTSRFDNQTTKYCQNGFAMASTVLTTPYSLGYAPLFFIDQAGLPYAIIRNRNQKDVKPRPKALAAALGAALPRVNNDVFAITDQQVADAPGDDAYPLTQLFYLAYHTKIDSDCETRREVWKFFNWILTSNAANSLIVASVGFGPFDYDHKVLILDKLKEVNCEGEQLLHYNYPEKPTALREAVISIAAILLTIVLLTFLTLGWKRKNAMTKAAGLAFASAFLLGCSLNYLSVFIWALYPTTDRICTTRYILTSIGYSLVLGSMFAKSWEVQKYLQQASHIESSVVIQEVPWWKFCRIFFSVISVNALALLILGIVDPPKSYFHIYDPLDLNAYHTCYVVKTTTWAGVEFVYFALLTVWGGYLAWKTRDIWERHNYPNESRSILTSIYNLIFCLTILIPLTTILESNLEAEFFVVSLAIVFPTSFAFFSVWGPKVISFIASSFGAARTEKTESGHPSKKWSKQSERPRRDEGPRGRGETHNNLIIIEEDQKEREHSVDHRQIAQGTAAIPTSPL